MTDIDKGKPWLDCRKCFKTTKHLYVTESPVITINGYACHVRRTARICAICGWDTVTFPEVEEVIREAMRVHRRECPSEYEGIE